jgi:hypothetical protein
VEQQQQQKDGESYSNDVVPLGDFYGVPLRLKMIGFLRGRCYIGLELSSLYLLSKRPQFFNPLVVVVVMVIVGMVDMKAFLETRQ